MNLSRILSENSFLNPLLEKAIKDRKEVIKLNRLINGAGLLIIFIIVLAILIPITGTILYVSYIDSIAPATTEPNTWYSSLFGIIINNSYKFFYGGLIIGYLINLFYSKPFSKKLRKFQELEEASINRIIQLVYPNYTYESTRFADKQHKFELSKIFGWIGKPIVSYKIYGSLENKATFIKTKIFDIGAIKHDRTPSFIYFIPFINFLYYYARHSIQLLKNIFTRSTPEANLNDFRGLYAISEFNKKLKGYTLVLPRSIESQIQQWDVNEQERVELEDVRFTEQFLVYSTDQVEARYAISTTMMESIVAFWEKAKLPIMLAFVENKLHIAIENKDGVFSIPTAKSDALEVLQEITEEIEVTQNIVDDFNLNRQIFN